MTGSIKCKPWQAFAGLAVSLQQCVQSLTEYCKTALQVCIGPSAPDIRRRTQQAGDTGSVISLSSLVMVAKNADRTAAA